MEDKKNKYYQFRFEVASERKVVPGITVIPEADLDAAKNHISEDEKFKMIQRYAFDGDIDAVNEMLSEFPVYKREDLKKMLIRSAMGRGKSLKL